MSAFLDTVEGELAHAREKHAPINSAHEGYAVILEELEEFWEEVRQQTQVPERMYTELIHLAAMAARCAEDVVVPLAGFISPGTKP